MNGIQLFLDLLARAGINHLFGNPGTTELPLNEALTTDPRFRYVFANHEIPVMAMADGYAMASGGIGVVNLHTACGLGNAMGMLFNAKVEGTPLLVTAGQQDARLRFSEPVLEGDLVAMASPLVKWAYEVNRVDDLPNAVRRAVQVALTPPTGPVFLSLPLDVQMAPADHVTPMAPTRLDRGVRPASASVERAAKLLANARNPIILAGSRVTESHGCDALVQLAERLGVPVLAECSTSHGRLPMPSDHPLYAGTLPVWSPDVRARLDGYDVAFVVGMNLLRLYIHMEPEYALPPTMLVIHLDCNPWEIGKNYPCEVGMLGDPKAGMLDLIEALSRYETPILQSAPARIEASRQEKQAKREELAHELGNEVSVRPMTGATLMATLATVLPANVAVVEEAPTTHQHLLERLMVARDPYAYFSHRGWALGWGIGCALGVKLAWPQRPVLAIVGDGAAHYGIQALWSAASQSIPIVVVIANNQRYQILRNCGAKMDLPAIEAGTSPGMAVTGVDFVGLANAYGVEAYRVTEPQELAQRVREAFTKLTPTLIDAMIQ